MNQAPSKQLKAWLVEAHALGGERSGPEYAVLKISQPFVEAVAHRTVLLDTQWSALQEAIASTPNQVCSYAVGIESSIKFVAFDQSVVFEGEKVSNRGLWELSRNNAGSVLRFISDDGHTTASIPVSHLVGRFASQNARDLEIFTRQHELEIFTDLIDEVLMGGRSWQPLPDSTKMVLEDALPICRQLLGHIEPTPHSTQG